MGTKESEPLKPLQQADEPVRTLIMEVMKLEQEFINQERPHIYAPLLEKIREVIK